ncbi:MAG: sodium:proton antiporter [Gammaproteobacteria bacterium]|nr:sodium:proton antiporter [Gammaproteobacteria bacterium]
MNLEPVILLVVIGVMSIFSQILAYRLRIPAILPLLVSGLLLGPGLGALNSDLLFGDLLFPIVSLSVAIILFEGALSLNFKDLGTHGKSVRNLCTLGTLISWIVVAPAAYYIIGVSWEMAFLFSAIVTVTGPTVVIPMIRAVRPSSNVSQILRWEGIIIDPIGALLAVLVFEYIIVSNNALTHTLFVFGKTVFIGSFIGVVSGFVLGRVLQKSLVPEYLVNTTVLIAVLSTFELSNVFAHESGLLAVTIMGIWLANKRDINIDNILEFKETLSVLLISGLFIILAARIEISALLDIAHSGVLLLLVMLFVARPINVFLSTHGSKLRWQEKFLITWMSPRGIVAAAVSALFALKLELVGFENADILVTLVFFVIVFTVTFQSLTSTIVANLLGEREPIANGFLIFGGSVFGRMLAKELMERGFKVKYADTNWEAISAARMAGISTYFGNPSSEHARRTMDLTGIGNVLVLSPYQQLNPQVTQYFQYVLGEDKVFGVSFNGKKGFEGHLPSEKYMKSLGLFSNTSYSKLASATAKGAIIKTTAITNSFTYEDYQEMYKENCIPLFYITDKEKVRLNIKGHEFDPHAGTQLVSLINAAATEGS